MKQLIMPTADMLRNEVSTYKDIVSSVLKMRPYIECKRHEIIKIPSVTLAEFEKELDKSGDFSRRLKVNIE